MKKNKNIQVIIYTILVIIITILICVIIKGNKTQDSATNMVENISNKGEENKLISNTEYVEVQLEDSEADGLEYTDPVRIYDESVISRLEKIANSGTEYEPKSTAWPDISPIVTFTLENENRYVIYANDDMGDEEDEGNYITIEKFNKNKFQGDFEWKKTFKIEEKLGEYITQLYNQFK